MLAKSAAGVGLLLELNMYCCKFLRGSGAVIFSAKKNQITKLENPISNRAHFCQLSKLPVR